MGAYNQISEIVREIKVNIPDVATKQLKLRTCNGLKRATVSSNWLVAFGFDGTRKVVEESLGPKKGIRVRLANDCDVHTKKVYTRLYKNRSANPLNPVDGRKERLIEIASQKLINDSLGEDCTRVHITFRKGEILFTPINEIEYNLLQQLDHKSQINTLVAMTGGVDCHTLESRGFSVHTVLSYRPQDARDRSDYTELDCMSALVNSSPRVLVNEDIYSLDVNRLTQLIGNTPITVGHFSLTCEEYSLLKNKKAKEEAIENLSSTIDSFIPMLSVLDAIRFPVLVVENVEGFLNSASNDILTLQLRRRGYHIHKDVFDSRHFGGNSLRKRMYMVATTLDAPFAFPLPNKELVADVWNDIVLPNWEEIKERDVTDTKVMKDALKTGRARIISKDKAFSPTLARSQSQDPKDAVVIEREGRYYRLPLSVQMAINSIPESFDLNWAPIDKAAQIIGQSICCSLHGQIMDCVRDHIVKAAYMVRNKSLQFKQFAMGF